MAGEGLDEGESPAGCIQGARICRSGDGGRSGVDDGDACGGWPAADDDLERGATGCGVLDGVGSEFAGEAWGVMMPGYSPTMRRRRLAA